MKVKCIKDFYYMGTGEASFIEKGDVLYSEYGKRDSMYRIHDKKSRCITFMDGEDFNDYFEIINTPPYVRCYFYKGGNKHNKILHVEGWLENDYQSNIIIFTKDGALCKFELSDIKQMYQIEPPAGLEYNGSSNNI